MILGIISLVEILNVSLQKLVPCALPSLPFMKVVIAATVLTTISLAHPALSESIAHTRQLLATKQCQSCDLSGAGLVLANLTGANLSGANLSGANLSRANLSGADLTGANLVGASLYGANLTGAKLAGAQLNGADFRDAYLYNVSFGDADVNVAHLQGAIGIPTAAAKAEDFYRWGMLQGQKGDSQGAINYFNQALTLDPKFALAYMGRGIARYQLLDRKGAMEDAKVADILFLAQGNATGNQTAQAFIKELQAPLPSEAKPKSKGNFMNIVGLLGSAALKLFLPF
jgi:uncharacterized protein YjbI with pentapeptide repeats